MKKFANWNMCYLCGFDVENGHTSMTCPTHLRKALHDMYFTQQNAQQYIASGHLCCTKNRHKTQFPSVSWFGVANLSVTSKWNSSLYVNTANLSYPTQFLLEDDNITITTSNVSTYAVGSYKACAISALLQNEDFAGAMCCLNTVATIADSGATRIFVMEGANVINKCRTTHPLKVTLADGRQVVSTHIFNIHIDGLLFVLMGHIILDLSTSLLFEIRVLTEVGCDITFNRHKYTVRYNGKIILSGDKDPSTDLLILPLDPWT
jgi:hypothetical protein